MASKSGTLTIPTLIPVQISVKTAYHVTNQLASRPQPLWTELNAYPAKHRRFDKGGLIGKKLVFFSTTRYDYEVGKEECCLPTTSIHPIYGEDGERYWRVQVPLERFNDCRIKVCNAMPRMIQKTLVLCKLDDADFKKNEDFTNNPNRYLWRDSKDNKWYTNNYTNPTTPYFVNFAVKGNVDITGCQWDTVEHREKDGGNQRKFSYSEPRLNFILFY